MKRNIVIGKNCKIDKTAKLGVKPLREIKGEKILYIGDNAIIRSNTVIYLGTKIGKNFQTGHNVIIREENIIGENFQIWSNSVIDYGCKIGNNVKIHSNCYISQYTIIEDDVFIAPGVIFANDLHPGCEYSKKCMHGPVIKKGTKIGCNVTVLPFITIGEYSLVGAGAVVCEDVPAYSVVYGNPAVVRKKIWQLKCKTGLTDKPYKF
ncbi:MAG: N-acetyltransferase [Endomicrobia bacterium]|nr:N-acetyltransferase [Endomicrobiia bacterium]